MISRLCLRTALALGLALPATANSAPAAEDFAQRAEPDRVAARIEALEAFGGTDSGGTHRVAYSEADIAARAHVIEILEGQGLDVRIDTGGNILARRAGTDSSLPPILFGSHIDSVPDGGSYDGNAGVVAALEVIDLLNDADHRTTHPLELVVFSNEEGGLLGSLAMTGNLKPSALDEVTHSGLTIGEGIRAIGGDPDNLKSARVEKGDYVAFIELHIEQGAILDEAGEDIGVVQGIVGIGWWDVTITGMPNHAGTTPMDRRRDAMVAAAELTLAVNRIASEMPGRQVATVGRIQAFPGAPNVIPGRVEMSLEIRDLEQKKIDTVFSMIADAAERISNETDTTISFRSIDVASHPAPTDPRMRDIIANAAEKLGLSYRRMPSGAGHDAQDMVPLMPTGMIFVPSEGGISHSPDEFTEANALARGADVLLHSILAIDDGALHQR